MRYNHYQYHGGDGICQTLYKFRKELGDRWTASMASYAIGKIRSFEDIKWREPVQKGQRHEKEVIRIFHSRRVFHENEGC